MIVFFTMTQLRRIFRFKAQCRWLEAHRKMASLLGWVTIPHRTTLSRRYMVLYATICRFVLFIAQYAPDLDARFSPQHLIEDKSLFKVLGPVWHQSDRKAGRIPDKLRNLDTDATWSKSSYHGWVLWVWPPYDLQRRRLPRLGSGGDRGCLGKRTHRPEG